MGKNKWYKLDNAAKIFPPTTSYYDPKIFRFSVILKEDINEKNLSEATLKTLEDFPTFTSILKKGIFWYYLEETNIKPIVKKETSSPCEKLNTDLLFEVTYYKNKINLEVYHALTDGTGCIVFFRSLIYNYLVLTYNLKEKAILNSSSNYEKEKDSFKKYVDHDIKVKNTKKPNAYNLRGAKYPEGKLNIITGTISTKKFIELAKKYNTTVTVLAASLIMKSIANTLNKNELKNPIAITVPIDLRKYFKSETIRNFFNVMHVNYNFSKNKNNLEDIITSIKDQFEKSLTKESVTNGMNRLAKLEEIFILRLIPLIIKNPILNLSYKITRKKQTLGLSNVGKITMPEVCNKYIENFIVMNSTDKMEMLICSYEDNLSISIASHFINNEIETNFFRSLKDLGFDIIISGNELNGGIYE